MPEVEMRTEKAKLRKTLRRWDLALFGACAIIGFDSLAYTTASGYGQAITWLIITFFIFLIPFGLLTAEVTAAFPAEGGLYAWCRMAFGKLFGEVATMMYWLSNAGLAGRHADGRDDRRHRRLLHAQAPARHVGVDRRRPGLHLGHHPSVRDQPQVRQVDGQRRAPASRVIIMVGDGDPGHPLPRPPRPAQGHRAGQLVHAQRYGLPRDHRRHRLPLGRLRARRLGLRRDGQPTEGRAALDLQRRPITTGMYIVVMLCMLLVLTEKELGAARAFRPPCNVVMTAQRAAQQRRWATSWGVVLSCST